MTSRTDSPLPSESWHFRHSWRNTWVARSVTSLRGAALLSLRTAPANALACLATRLRGAEARSACESSARGPVVATKVSSAKSAGIRAEHSSRRSDSDARRWPISRENVGSASLQMQEMGRIGDSNKRDCLDHNSASGHDLRDDWLTRRMKSHPKAHRDRYVT